VKQVAIGSGRRRRWAIHAGKRCWGEMREVAALAALLQNTDTTSESLSTAAEQTHTVNSVGKTARVGGQHKAVGRVPYHEMGDSIALVYSVQ